MVKEEKLHLRMLEERVAALEHENERLRSNRDFEKIAQNAPVGIYRTTLDGRILMANLKFAEMFGFSSPDDLIREINSVADELYNDMELRSELIAAAGATDGFIMQEGTFKRRNGSLFMANYRTRAIKDHKGNIQYFEGVIEDVSEHLRISNALKRSELLLQSLLENTPDGILLYDLQLKKTVFFNKDSFCGYSRAFILNNKDYLGYVHPEDVDRLNEVRRRVFAGEFREKTESVEYRLKDTGGQWQWIENRYAMVSENGTGLPEQFLVMLSVVTERKKAENELKESWDLYNVLVNTLPEVVVIADLDGNLKFVSPNIDKLSLREDQSEVIGTNIFDWLAPEQHAQAVENIKYLAEHDYAVNTYGFVRSDGSEFLGKVHSALVRDANGAPKSMVSIIQDITDEINSIKALRTSEERFRELFDQAQVGMAILDDHGRIVRANASIQQMLGYTDASITAMNVLQLMPKRRQRKARTAFKNLIAGKSDQVETEMIFVTSEGIQMHVLLQIIRLDPIEPNDNQYLCQVVNIDAIKRVEKELKTRNRELNNLVYKVSHDLKAPLLSIKGLAHLMRLENDPKSHYGYIDLIEERVRRLEEFIRDILSHSRNLNTDVEISNIDVRELIDRCFSQIAYHPNFKYLDKIIEIKTDQISSDETRLFEILRNLISNAVVYSCPSARESYVKISVLVDLEKIHIDIEDNGVGIDDDHIDKIFEMFYRANVDIEGTGIGLYIVKQSLEKINGSIKVESQLGKGSLFSLELPNLSTV